MAILRSTVTEFSTLTLTKEYLFRSSYDPHIDTSMAVLKKMPK